MRSEMTKAQLLASLFSILPLLKPTAAASYNMVKDYAGSGFFNEWTFYNHYDNLTNGDTIFVSAAVAASAKLAYADSNNHAIIKVDNTSTVPYNQKRNTVRISSNNSYAVGSLWIADIYHVPYGCSVWPAWWSQAAGWPAGGEIDTFEGVNLVTNNQMGLHTLPGCTTPGGTQVNTSQTASTDCSYQANSNEGCKVVDTNTDSYGAAFASAGGGVFVTELAASGISVWFFTRQSVPSSISSNASTLDTSTFGTPTANWPSTSCSMSQFFAPQSLIFDITLCGDFAGPPSIFQQTCSGVCYNDYVMGNGSNYANAYFDIASVRVFGVPGQSTVVNGTSSTSSNSSSSSNPTGSPSSRSSAWSVTIEGRWMSMLALALGLSGVAMFV